MVPEMLDTPPNQIIISMSYLTTHNFVGGFLFIPCHLFGEVFYLEGGI